MVLKVCVILANIDDDSRISNFLGHPFSTEILNRLASRTAQYFKKDSLNLHILNSNYSPFFLSDLITESFDLIVTDHSDLDDHPFLAFFNLPVIHLTGKDGHSIPWNGSWYDYGKAKRTSPRYSLNPVKDLGGVIYKRFTAEIENMWMLGLPLRVVVTDLSKIGGLGYIPTIKIEYGVLHPSDALVANINGELIQNTREVVMCIYHEPPHDRGVQGDTFWLDRTFSKESRLKRGTVIGKPCNPPSSTQKFVCLLVFLSQTDETEYRLCAHDAFSDARFIRVFRRTLNRRTGKLEYVYPADVYRAGVSRTEHCFNRGDIRIVEVELNSRITLEYFSDFPTLGRFLLLKDNKINAVGIRIKRETWARMLQRRIQAETFLPNTIFPLEISAKIASYL